MKVYIVCHNRFSEEDSYKEYEAVFETEEKAKEYCKERNEHNRGEYDPDEEWLCFYIEEDVK